jgi:hypothetical protein
MFKRFHPVPSGLHSPVHGNLLGLLACIMLLLPIAGAACAQTYGESRIISTETHPGIRSPRMLEAWRLYNAYQATQARIRALNFRIADLTDQIQNQYQPGFMLGALAGGNLANAMRAAEADLRREQQLLDSLVEQWAANDLVYGEFYLGPLENATIPLTVRYGVNGEWTVQMDPIMIGLIRWDQAVAGQQNQAGSGAASLDGRWHLSTDNGRFLAELIISGGGGTVTFYGLPQEQISGVSYDPSSGTVSFTRPQYPTTFTGTVTGTHPRYGPQAANGVAEMMVMSGEYRTAEGGRGPWGASLEER